MKTNTQRPLIFCAFLGIALIFIIHAVYLSAVAEDAFISFRFAQNLATGQGLVWNPGEAPVEGYTNFLWVIICAAGLRLGLNVLLLAQAIGVAASLATLAYAYLFCRRLLGVGAFSSLLPCLYLASAGPFATWATSGMETNLFAFLILASCYHEASYWLHRSRASLYLAFLLCFLATLTRPEGFGVFVVLVGVHLTAATFQKDTTEVSRAIPSVVLAYALPFLIYFAWRFAHYGYLLPNTYYAKTGGTFYQWYRGFKYVLYFGFHFVFPLAPVFTIIAWEGIDLLISRKKSATLPAHRAETRFGVLLCVAMVLSYVCYIVFIGGDYMAMYRFFVPIFPLFYILVTYGCYRTLRLSIATPARRFVVGACLVAGLIGTLIQSTPLEERLFAATPMTHGQYRGVCTERWHSRRLAVIGRFFSEYKEDDHESIATGAIGAISYYSGLRVYDFAGLEDTFIAHKQNKDLGKGLPGHEKGDAPYVLSKKPTYVMFSRGLTKETLAYPGGVAEDVKAMLEGDYRVVSQWLDDRENGESGYFTFFERIAR